MLHSSINILPPAPPGGDSLRYSWQKSRELIDDFWVRFSKEYLTTLHRRKKWTKTVPNLYVGQMVLVMDEMLPRDQWRIAVVDSVQGDGQHVRSAVVRTAAGKKIERHCTKLVGLEMDA